jgi:prephenate dehydrogenase
MAMDVDLKYGVIGGGKGLGAFFVKLFIQDGFSVSYSSLEGDRLVNNAVGFYSDNVELVNDCDIIFLMVPISSMISVLKEIYPYLKDKVLVDCCSVKKHVVKEYEKLYASNPIEMEYISIHPMFGEDISSIENQVIISCYSSLGYGGFLAGFNEYLIKKRVNVFHLDYAQHDRIMGVVQGLNHFNVFVSAKTLDEVGFEIIYNKAFSSPSYRIFIVFFTRYVLQNPRLYAEIQMYNDECLSVLKVFKAKVDELYSIIEKKDEDAFVDYVSDMKLHFENNIEDVEFSNKLIEFVGDISYGRVKNKKPNAH